MADIYPISGEEAEASWYSNETATFGDRVVAGRDAIGLTQQQLARRLGVKLKTLQNWENDVSEPRANKLSMLAGMLNVSLIWLLTGEGEGLSAPGDAEENADMGSILAELRTMRMEASRFASRLGRLEKKLRQASSQSTSA